jgi:hypothetical protein
MKIGQSKILETSRKKLMGISLEDGIREGGWEKFGMGENYGWGF